MIPDWAPAVAIIVGAAIGVITGELEFRAYMKRIRAANREEIEA